MTDVTTSEGRGWKRFSILVPILTALIMFASGWFAKSQLGKDAEADRILRGRELEQKRLEHEENARIQRLETVSKFLPYLRDKNPEVRNVALKAVRELGMMPIERGALRSPSVSRLFRSRPLRHPAETVRNQRKLAQDSLLPAQDLRLSLRSDTVPRSDSTAPVRPDSAARRRGAYGLWQAADGTYWVGGACSSGQVCASIVP
jgi:hypothetical protein